MNTRGFFLSKISFLIILLGIFISLTSLAPVPTSLVKDVLACTNQFRKSNGKPALVMMESLNAIAQQHSEKMAKGNIGFGHSGFTDRHKKVQQIFRSCTMSENVAYGASTGKAVVNMWQRSSGHRDNLLGNYKYIGIGTATNSRGTVFYTQIFVR